MSYRAFKHLFGETSLERKCRFLLGAATLLLITASFSWYAHQTEDLAYEQTTTTGRLLVSHIIAKYHADLMRSGDADKWKRLPRALEGLTEDDLPPPLQNYQYVLIKPNALKLENQPADSYERRLLEDFVGPDSKDEDRREMPSQPYFHYYRA